MRTLGILVEAMGCHNCNDSQIVIELIVYECMILSMMLILHDRFKLNVFVCLCVRVLQLTV